MDTISQRQLRNQSGEVLRRVADGESILITNGGVPAAMIVPIPKAQVSQRQELIAKGLLVPRAGGRGRTALPTPVRPTGDMDAAFAEDRSDDR